MNGNDLVFRDEASIDCPNDIAVKLWADAYIKQLKPQLDQAFLDNLVYGESRIVVTPELMRQVMEDSEASVQEGLKRPGLTEQLCGINIHHYTSMTVEEIETHLNEIKL